MITPTDIQHRAIRALEAWCVRGTPPVFYLAGYAGTGKSTVVDIALKTLLSKGRIKHPVTCAYTGKAASVLRSKGVPATTIHKLIYLCGDDPITGRMVVMRRMDRSKDPIFKADLIVVDECSMIDEKLAADILSFGKKVLVLGDPGQLPPFGGAGFFTAREPDFFLSEIVRQAAENPIIRLASMARRGERIKLGNYGDGVAVKAAEQHWRCVLAPATQPIVSRNLSRWKMTGAIRKARGFLSDTPASGERVMCVRNNPGKDIFNGQQGMIVKADAVSDTVLMDCEMDDAGVVPEIISSNIHFQEHRDQKKSDRRPDISQDAFDFGYVLTCHKAQGSEWPHVTVLDEHFGPDRDKWLYTAITRASKELTILRRSA